MKNFLRFDLVIQTLLALLVTTALCASIMHSSNIIAGFFILFFFGAWQLFSALIVGTGLNDKFRGIYLLTAIAYCGLGVKMSFLLSKYVPHHNFLHDISEFYIAAFFIISFVAGLFYLTYSYRDYRSRYVKQ